MFKRLVSFLVAVALICNPAFAGVSLQIGGKSLVAKSGTAASLALNTAPFYAPLTTSLIPARGTGLPTFTRASTKTFTDFEGLTKTVPAGSAAFTGARMVQNLLLSTEDFTSANWNNKSAGVTATNNYSIAPDGENTAGRIQFSGPNLIFGATPAGMSGTIATGSCYLKGTAGETINLTSNGTDSLIIFSGVWQHFANVGRSYINGLFSINTYGGTARDVQIWHPLYEIVTGQANQNPSEYVSVGVLPAPYQGAGADGVQFFDYENGNTVTNNVVTEAQGPAIPDATLKGYLSEDQSTNYFLNSSAPVTQTLASLATGTYTAWIKGIGSLTTSAGTATITGAGAATAGAPDTFTVTGAGTVIETVAGTVTTAQVENSPIPTSFIPTAGTAVTRAADQLLYPSSGNVSATAGTVYAEVTSGNKTNAYSSFVSSYNLSGSGLAYTDYTNRLAIYDEGTPLERTFGLTFIQPTVTPTKIATEWGGTSTNGAIAGVLGTPSGFSGNMIMGTSIAIGDDVSNDANINGNIKEVHLWLNSLPVTTFQAITAP